MKYFMAILQSLWHLLDLKVIEDIFCNKNQLWQQIIGLQSSFITDADNKPVSNENESKIRKLRSEINEDFKYFACTLPVEIYLLW